MTVTALRRGAVLALSQFPLFPLFRSPVSVVGKKYIGEVPVCFALVDVDLDAARYDVGVG